MANFNTLKAQIAAKIHDNTEQEITAKDVRDCFDDTIDTINAAKEDEGAIAPAQWGGITGDLEDQTDLKNALDAKYVKPASGIPGSDLDNGVRSDLNKARSAVQPGDLALVASTGDYDDLLYKPSLATVATSGDYDDLLNKPTIPAAQVQADWNEGDNTKADYIKNKPTIPAAQVNADWDAVSGVAQILNKPTIPSAPGTLDTTATTAQATSASEALSGSVVLHKVSKTGDYGDLLNKPSIPAAQVNSDWDAVSGVAQILNKPTIPAAPGTLDTDNTGAQTVSSSESLSGTVKLHKVAKTGSYAHLNNKPTIPVVESLTNAEIDTIWAAV